MCELFGASLNSPIDFEEILKEFYSHSLRHPHGWGLVFCKDGCYQAIKEPVRAIDSKKLQNVLPKIGKQSHLLAHIRLATVGVQKEENTHPFSGKDIEGRTWFMIHNGTIYSGSELISYMEKQQGNTDSERIFLYLMDLLEEEYKKSGSLLLEQRFHVVDRLVHQLAPRNKLNLMLFDGEMLYVHKNMKTTLSFQKRKEGILFSTDPFSEDWEELELCQLCSYKDGKECFRSDTKTEEFIPSLEYISAMAAMHI